MNRIQLGAVLESLLTDLKEGLDLEDAFGIIQELYWRLQKVHDPEEAECTQEKT